MKQTNIYKFDASWEMQEIICDKRLDEQDYIGALQAAKYSRSGGGPQREKKTAQVYFEMQLYDLAAHCFFKFLDACSAAERSEAYEGLGLCYLNMGEVTLAQYYLNMSVLNSEDSLNIDPEMLEFVRDLAEEERLNFKLVHPPELADYTDLLNQGKQLMRGKKYGEAAQLLEKVPENSAFYKDAANDIVIARLLDGDLAGAEKTAAEILQKHKDDITALSSLQSVYLQTGKNQEAKSIADRLYKIDTDNIDDLYKAASVFCEQNMPHKALEKYKQIERDAPFDCDILFTIAALYHNTGNLYAAVKYLRDIIDIYGEFVAKYYLEKVNKSLFEGRDLSFVDPMPYTMRLPSDEKKRILSQIAKIAGMKKSELAGFKVTSQIRDLFNWCLNNDEITEPVLEAMTAAAISNAYPESLSYIEDLLLNPLFKDSVKFELVGRLCERNFSGELGIVMSGIYKKTQFFRVNIGKTARARFLRAYGLCFSKFSMIKDNYGWKISLAAERLYGLLDGRFLKSADYKTLAAAIYMQSGIKEVGRSVKKIAALFDADYKILKEISAL